MVPSGPTCKEAFKQKTSHQPGQVVHCAWQKSQKKEVITLKSKRTAETPTLVKITEEAYRPIADLWGAHCSASATGSLAGSWAGSIWDLSKKRSKWIGEQGELQTALETVESLSKEYQKESNNL